RYKMPATSIYHADFVTQSPQGHIRAIEIMVHPHKYPFGLAKVEMFKEQYPYIPIKLITSHYYGLLERRYRASIEADSHFCGWETKDDNLYTNPEKYAR
ncbi:MAG: hypothetical protein Q7R49_00330, partial [Candidatus Daviesbacteria bacterium]|nr:hypothetical protein [Candidatus Daviesbacteria bacterium]